MIRMEAENSKGRFLLKCTAIFALLAGFFMLGGGLGILVGEEYHAAISSIPIRTLSLLFLVAGVLSILAAVFGFYLQKKFSSLENATKNVSILFSGCLVLAGILAIIAGILGLVYANKVDTQLENELYEKLKLYGVTGHYETLWNVDRVQSKDKCCGVINYADWRNTGYGGKRYDKVPDSCCKEDKHGCGFEFIEADINKEGCLEIVKSKIRLVMLMIGVGGLILGLFEIILLIVKFVSQNRDGAYKRSADTNVELTGRNETPQSAERLEAPIGSGVTEATDGSGVPKKEKPAKVKNRRKGKTSPEQKPGESSQRGKTNPSVPV